MADSASFRTERPSRSVPGHKRSIRRSTSDRRKLAQKKNVKQKQSEELLIAQSKVLETLSGDTSLKEMLNVFAETIEHQSKDMLCSLLLLDGKTLHHAAAPSLPDEYTRAIDGATIGPRVGSCGTAAFTKKQIIVSDIETDPLWADYRNLALRHGLRACWSTPILRNNGEVLGTFALYYRKPRTPNKHELRLIANWTRLAALGIKRKLAQESLEAEQRLLRELFRAQEYERRLTACELHDGIAQYAAGAIMHLEGGSTKVKVVLKRSKNRIQLSVRDWGKGFAFTQISDECQGLRGIRERVRLLGGLVGIDSEPGQGTSISVDLPFLGVADVP